MGRAEDGGDVSFATITDFGDSHMQLTDDVTLLLGVSQISP